MVYAGCTGNFDTEFPVAATCAYEVDGDGNSLAVEGAAACICDGTE